MYDKIVYKTHIPAEYLNKVHSFNCPYTIMLFVPLNNLNNELSKRSVRNNDSIEETADDQIRVCTNALKCFSEQLFIIIDVNMKQIENEIKIIKIFF
jgi:hypothetical protein